ncbi:MAG TPA: flagellar export protein FliJ [Clostridiales bacterium]|nr:flagellar export protein FliJ [Clostridiales bacterium]
MRKFVFSLYPLYQLKKTMKDKLQAEYSAAEAALAEKTRIRDSLKKKLQEERRAFEAKIKQGMTISKIKLYLLHFEEMQERIKLAQKEVNLAQMEVNRKKAELIAVHKEIKTLEKLYQKQYAEHVKEEEKREYKILEDVVSFNISGGEAQNANALS